MSEAVFPLHISQALDRLTVPAFPVGFSDRLLARIAAGDLPDDTDAVAAALPPLRRQYGIGGWKRSGRIIVVASAFGLATATAAASGVFGDPVYIPVVSQALASAKIVEMPVAKPSAKQSAVDNKTQVKEAEPASKAAPVGKDLVLARIAEMRADPAYRNLPKGERQVRLKDEIAKLLAEGTVQKVDVKAAWVQLATEREATAKARFKQDVPELERKVAEFKQRAKSLTPEQKEKVREAVNQLTEAQRAELQVLRRRLRDAAPAERRAVQAEIRTFWQRAGVEPTAEGASNGSP